jgi:hypothetical protein
MLDLNAMDQRLADLNEPLSIWYAQVDQESNEVFNASPITGENFRERGMEALRIARAHAGEGPWESVHALLDELCAEYLRFGWRQSAQIRTLVRKYPSMQRALFGDYLGRVKSLLEATSDPRWLRLSLAAISIENNYIDFRDTYIALGDLYLTAVHMGINPKPAFRAAARVSAWTTQGRNYSIPMCIFLGCFRWSAYFQTEIRPQL